MTHRRAAKSKCTTCVNAATRGAVIEAVEAMVKNPFKYRHVTIASLHDWVKRSAGYESDYHAFYRPLTKERCGALWERVMAARAE